MKRFLSLLSVFVLCLGLLAGCQSDKKDSKSGKKAEKEPAVKGELYDAGNVTVLIPEGWKAFAVYDVFTDGDDPDAVSIIKGGKEEYDSFTKPYIRIDYYGPDTEMMGGLEDWYQQTTSLEPMKLGSHTWQGFTTTDYGGLMAVLWCDEGAHQYQASVQLEVDSGEKISLKDEDVQAILESVAPSDGSAQTPSTPTVSTPSYSWWDGGWYGWWCITNGTGDYAQFNNIAWDAYANIDVGGNIGSLQIWDTQSTLYEPLLGGTVSFEGTTMTLEECTFFQCRGWLSQNVTTVPMELPEGIWSTNYEVSSVAHFYHMIQITLDYEDPTNSANSFTANIFLKPWGATWEDVKNGITDGCLYKDMMPLYYEDWYLPLLEKGLTAPPDDFEAGKALLAW